MITETVCNNNVLLFIDSEIRYNNNYIRSGTPNLHTSGADELGVVLESTLHDKK
jgi:hypothetical protein